MHSKYWPEDLKGRVHLEDLDVDGRMILKHLLKEGGMSM
jgi:hypothetical protein